ncbi:dihydrofolate reductase family protein [Natronosporangium hydrolyticum]|uniref:Dihydrofolate reductase family protein n=1 Tax=Natronosporangium hydrolyticum TaxID=2811111 RepID=A0A895YGR6_9ACTN|nr:dihydrofolate reductase family protein [Natronosporangium hydrolyticum]
MRRLVYYVGISIDGYIAGPGNEVDFYPVGDDLVEWMKERHPELIPTHIRSQFGLTDVPNRRFDALVMGRGTYQPALDIGVTSPYSPLRQYVVSSTLASIADPSVELVTDDPVGLVRRLKAESSDKDICLAGGGKLAGTLLPEIDELLVKWYPVVAGAGIPAFQGTFNPTPFTPTRRESFRNGIQVTWFQRTHS